MLRLFLGGDDRLIFQGVLHFFSVRLYADEKQLFGQLFRVICYMKSVVQFGSIHSLFSSVVYQGVNFVPTFTI